jgi:Ca2+-binding RTX toxin-like protein
MSIIVGTPNNGFLSGTGIDDQIFDSGDNDIFNISGVDGSIEKVVFSKLNKSTTPSDLGTKVQTIFDNAINTNTNESVKGNGKRNQLFGTDGDDTIDGTDGNDTIDGRGGNDKLSGGKGNDTFQGSQGDDNINGGDGLDTADYSKLGQSIKFLAVGIVDKGKLGKDQLLKVETVIVDASVTDNTIDTSQSLPGVSVTADLEAQTISANNVPKYGTLTFNIINFDNVIGTNESDLIVGDKQSNQLFGNDGNDRFKGSQGNDNIDGGNGLDTADYSNLGQSITLSSVGIIEKAGGFGKDQLLKVETIIADASVTNNTIDGSQSLPGVSAIVDLEAQTISANNVPKYGKLPFTIINFDNVIGTTTNDILAGDDQSNQLFGNDGDDTIDGRGGNDTIDGGGGSDNLAGGLGDDTFKGSQGKDSIDGGDGFDTADYSKLGKAIALSSVGIITKADGFGTDQVFKVETVIADASVTNNTIDTSQSLPGISITANLQTQSISINNVPKYGTLPFTVINFDNVIGTNESDSITGDSQNNQLVGNDGDDSIIGGQGDDILIGGFGADKFIFNSFKEGIDTIKDYKFGQNDLIEVSKVGFGTTSIKDFSYDAFSGKLSFLGNQFALVENLSSNLNIKLV